MAILGAGALTERFAPASAAPAGLAADEATIQQILRATVQIVMYEDSGGAASEVGERGLGTLVRHEGETLILTHDHWRHWGPRLVEVQVHDAKGQLLLRMAPSSFHHLVRHRDGGTMLLGAPPEVVEGLVPAATGSIVGSAAGSRFWIAVRADGQTVNVVGVLLESLAAEDAPRYARLRAAQGTAVAPGDSGGGVWQNGTVVGNLWSGGLALRRSLWQQLLGGQTEMHTNLVVAALQPLAPDAGETQRANLRLP